MKNSVAIIFIILFFLITGGRYTVFKLQQKAIRKEIKTQIKQGVPEKSLSHIFLTNSNCPQLKWKHDHEFELNGVFYDVVRKVIVENGIIYHCITDKQETLLFTNLQNEVNKELQRNGSMKPYLQSFEYTNTNQIIPYGTVQYTELRMIYKALYHEKIYHQPDHNTIVHPPEFA